MSNQPRSNNDEQNYNLRSRGENHEETQVQPSVDANSVATYQDNDTDNELRYIT